MISNKLRGDYMSEEQKKEIEETVNILMKLDENSLLLVKQSAKILEIRQEMEKKKAIDNVT